MDPNIPGHYCVSLPEASGLMQPPIRAPARCRLSAPKTWHLVRKKPKGFERSLSLRATESTKVQILIAIIAIIAM